MMSKADSYIKIKQHIHSIAKGCGRDPKEITLITVSKTHPWEDIKVVYTAGCRDFGENRLQEALEKISDAPKDIHWHLIGTLQKNKVRKAIGEFSLIHSVDSLELAEKISECSQEADVVTSVLLQVNSSGEYTKHGLSCEEWRREFERVLSLPGIAVKGLMTIGPLSRDMALIRQSFRSLRELKEELQQVAEGEATLEHLSMGMSNDYPIAIEEGATLLRIGSAILGEREKKLQN